MVGRAAHARNQAWDDLSSACPASTDSAKESLLGTTRFPRLETLGWVPPVEITESEKEILMTFELPGLDKDDVTIEIDDNVLTLRGEKKSEPVEEDRKEFFLKEPSGRAAARSRSR